MGWIKYKFILLNCTSNTTAGHKIIVINDKALCCGIDRKKKHDIPFDILSMPNCIILLHWSIPEFDTAFRQFAREILTNRLSCILCSFTYTRAPVDVRCANVWYAYRRLMSEKRMATRSSPKICTPVAAVI